MANDNTLIIKINGSAKNFLDELGKVRKATKDTEVVLAKTAKVSGALFLGLVASIAAVTKVFADYETALVGVGKTTNITGKALKGFGKEVQNISKRIPIATNDLLGIAQAAGQLGITGKDDLLKFTETVAKLGVATDLAGEEAATSLARLLGLTRESVGSIDKLGSVLVALGNSSKASESEIVKMALSVAKSTGVFGVSSAEAAALGTVLKELGQEAQLGGSVIGKSFLKIQKAIDAGGVPLENLSRLTGIAGADLKKTFQEDSVGVFRSFLKGIGELEGGTSAIFKALQNFGLEGDEVNKILPILATNTNLLNKAFNTSQKELREVTALDKEAAAAFDTLNSRTKVLSNNIVILAADMGERFAGDVNTLVVGLTELVAAYGELSNETKDSIATFIKWGTAIAGAVAAISVFLLAAIKISAIITAIGAAFLPATIAASAFWVAVTGPVGLAIAGIAAVTAGIVGLYSVLNKDEPKTLGQINDQLKELAKSEKELEKLASTNRFGQKNRSQKKLEEIQKEIQKLEELKQAQIKASGNFGTGELLVRPEADTSPLDFNIAGEVDGPQVNAPLAADPETRAVEVDSEVKAVQDAEDKKKEIRSAASQERLAQKKAEGEAIKQQTFLDAATRANNLSAAEQALLVQEGEFAQQRRDLKTQEVAANNIEDAQERAAALENLALKNNLLSQQEENFAIKQAEVKAAEREREKLLQQELRELDAEERAALTEEDLELLRQEISTKDELDRAAARKKVTRRIKENKQEREDTKEQGTVLATLKKFFNSQEVQGVQQTTSNLSQLRESSSKKQQKIGKIAARINAALATAQGAIQAYTSLSVIPIVGPALGAAAAAALVSFGLEQQRKIDTVGAQSGGVVPGSGGGARDRVSALLEPGEVVVPNRLSPDFIQSFGRPTEPEVDGGGGPEIKLLLGFAENAIDILEVQRQEKIALGIISDEG